MTSGEDRFRDALAGLRRGDFSRLETLFDEARGPSAGRSWIVEWVDEGRFREHPAELAEALTCAAFLGRTLVIDVLISRGVAPSGGSGTGLDALHWAVNRGQLDAVRLLLSRGAARETISMHGGTPLGTAVWSAINEPRPQHAAIVEELLKSGVDASVVRTPTGSERIDALLNSARRN